MRPAALLLISALLAASGLAQLPPGSTRLLFRDVASEAGITFQHHGAAEKKYIMESMSGGLALFDFDNDGLVDVYLTDSLTVDTAKDPGSARSALYRNRGNGRFEDVTERAGVGHSGWAMGVCTADVDGDGWEDIYVTGLGRNYLYHNNHDGTFTDVAEPSGVTGGGWSAGCGFADYDRDGDLDLFVSRYVRMDLDHLPEFGKGGAGMRGEGRGATCLYRGVAVQCGPRGLHGESDFLFHERRQRALHGGGRKGRRPRSPRVLRARASPGSTTTATAGRTCTWPTTPTRTTSTRTTRTGPSRKSASRMGVAVSEDGGEQGSMGVAVGDYDNVGRLSLFVTNFAEEYAALYHNDVDHFTDVSFRSKTAAPGLPFVKWGTSFFDYDNDGLLDIIVVNGHVYPQVDQVPMGASAGYRQRKLLYHNRGDGTFDEVAAQFGSVMTEERVGRGLAVGDLDNDGRLDVVVNDLDGAAQVLHNELADVGHWLLVKLKGKGENTDAIGAVVKVKAGPLSLMRFVRSGSSYISQEDMRLHFGLGAANAGGLRRGAVARRHVTRL